MEYNHNILVQGFNGYTCTNAQIAELEKLRNKGRTLREMLGVQATADGVNYAPPEPVLDADGGGEDGDDNAPSKSEYNPALDDA